MKQCFRSDDDFVRWLRLFNGFYEHDQKWTATRANKLHIDEMGREIKPGEIYYKQDLGGPHYFKLSRASMEKLLSLVFSQSQTMPLLGGRLADEHDAERLAMSKRSADIMDQVHQRMGLSSVK